MRVRLTQVVRLPRNLDGAPPPSLPCSPSPSTSGGWPPTKEEVVKYHRMMSKEDKCCLCEFKISDPNPQEGRLCGLLESMWNHIEECHSEEEDWFDETFSSQFLDVWCRSLGAINPTGNFHFVRASVPQRLALPASNVAVGSVINLDFPILYVLNGNKELILMFQQKIMIIHLALLGVPEMALRVPESKL